MSTDTVINGQKLEKDNLIFEVLGCLDQCSAEVGAAKLKADDEIKQILTQIQKDLATFSSVVAGCNGGASPQSSTSEVLRSDSSDGGSLNWLENQISQLEERIDVPQKFILSGESEFEVRLSLARVAVRKTERRAVSLGRYQDLPQDFLDYLNRLSWFLFLLSLTTNR